MSKDVKKKPVVVDGFAWSAAREAELNDMAVTVFGRGPGKLFLAYLKQITSSAHGPHATDAELRHAAGQRHLVAIIDQRVQLGSKARKGGE